MRLLLFTLVLFSCMDSIHGQVLQKISGLESRFKETNMSITPNGKYLFFMSQRGGMPWSTRRGLMPGERIAQYDGDIWYAVKTGDSWSSPKCLGTNINTYSGEDEPNISADGQSVYFQSWRDGWEWAGGPYYRAELNGTEWGRPVGLGSNITQFFKDLDQQLSGVLDRDLREKNLYRDYIKYRTIYPFSWVEKLEKRGINFNEYLLGTDGMAISPDEKIFIVSAFNPKKKKYDLFISYRKGSSEWTYPVALKVPNRSNEITVFIAGDNKTVYFASDRAGGMGGYDIYKTTLLGGADCTPPENIGSPYNSTRDDYGFVVDPTDEKAYQIIDGDIHEVVLLEEAKPEETIVINGKVQDQFGNPLEARIQLIDLSDPNKTFASAKSNRNSGEYSFSFIKTPGRFNQIATTSDNLKGEKRFQIISSTDNTLEMLITIERPIPAEEQAVEEDPVVVNTDSAPPTEESGSSEAEDANVVTELKKSSLEEGAILQVDQLFFKADSDEVQAESFPVLDEIAKVLNQRTEIKRVEIGGHTNGLPPTDYCERLSSARAKKIYNYLIQKQVDKNRMVSRGYGKRLPIATNDTPEGRRQNQRVEIKILELK